MTVYNQTFEGQSDGTSFTAANSGNGAGDTAVDQVNITGTATAEYDSATSAKGTLSGLFTSVTTGDVVEANWNENNNWPGATEAWARVYVRFSDATPAANVIFLQFREGTSTTPGCDIRLNTSGNLQLRAPLTARYTSSTTLSDNTWYRIEVHVLSSATVGHIEGRIFYGANLHGSTPDESFGNFSDNWDTGSGDVGGIEFGIGSDPGQSNYQVWMDEVALSDESWIGSAVTGGGGGSGGIAAPYIGMYAGDGTAPAVGGGPPPVTGFNLHPVHWDAGGTENHVAPSPNGRYYVASADVGGGRVLDTNGGNDQWEYLPTSSENSERQVAGACILNDGTVFQASGGGGTSGRLIEFSPAGVPTLLASGLDIEGNDFSSGDSGPRPRPVGWTVLYDSTRDLVYVCTENGLFRYNRGTSTSNGIIALSGQSCRGFAHQNHAVVASPTYIHVCTRTNGLQRISTPHGSASAAKISGGTVTRCEDAAYIGDPADEAILMACHTEGVFMRSAGGTTTNISPATGNGEDGAALRWCCVATMDVSGTSKAIAGVINPKDQNSWVYRCNDIEAATGAGDWGGASPTLATLNLGSAWIRPTNRILGASTGSGGDNLVGVFATFFDPSDTTGNTVMLTMTLCMYRSTNFATANVNNILWHSESNNAAMSGGSDVHISADGDVIFTCADHNSLTIAEGNVFSGEVIREGAGGESDSWGTYSVGSGANKISAITVTSDTSATAAGGGFYFHKGAGRVNNWSDTGYTADTNGMGALSTGQRPRPGGTFGWDRGNGTYRFVTWGDGVGFLRSTVTVATSNWTTWQAASTGPTATTFNTNGKRPIVGAVDGSVLIGLLLTNGYLYRSLDEGVNWSRITSVSSTQVRRKGHIAYNETEDWLIYSSATEVWRINNVSGSATSTSINTARNDYGPVAIDSDGRAYLHMHDTGELLRFSDFATATGLGDATDIASGTTYTTRANGLAFAMDIGFINGDEYGFTTYQGAGAIGWSVPA